LAEQTGIISIGALICHALNAGIAFRISGACFFYDLLYLNFIGVNGDLKFIEYPAEILVQFGVKNNTDVLQAEAFSTACLLTRSQAMSRCPMCITP
jgi:hypothetical protein